MPVIANDGFDGFSKAELAEARSDTLALQRFCAKARLIGTEALLPRREWSEAARNIMALHEAPAPQLEATDSPTVA